MLQSTRMSPSRSTSRQNACWHLPLARVEVAAAEDGRSLESEPVEGTPGQLDQVAPGEDVVELDTTFRRDFLEERVCVVPGAEVRGGAAEAGRQRLVERCFPALEHCAGREVGLGQRVEQLLLAHLHRRHRQLEPVAMTQRPGGLIAQAGELAHVVGDRGAHGLRRLPGLAALVRVVTRAEDALDLVVSDLAAAHHAAVRDEAGLHRSFQLDDAAPQGGRHLMREERVMEQRRAGVAPGVGLVAPRLCDGAEEIRLRQEIRERELGLDAAGLRLR